MAKKWIQSINGGKGPKKNALHKELGIPADKKIPAKTLDKAATKPGIEGKRARLAKAFKGMKKGAK